MDNVVYEEIAAEILDNGANVDAAKIKICRRYSLEHVPSNADVLNNISAEKRNALQSILRKKPVRTISGVAVLAVMTSPLPCPHGRCIYCPVGKDAPQSYTGHEPAALRAKRADYDPFTQVSERLSQLHHIGHNVEKAELIVMGGTFPARPFDYQEWFVRRCFDAMNSFDGPVSTSEDIEGAHALNENSTVKNVGVTFETRPDFAKEKHIDTMLRLGATRIEMGVQTLREEVYTKVERGHTVEDVVYATRVAKDAGLKVGYHMMPGLFSSVEEDVAVFEKLFRDPDFKPDMLKIYPTLVIEDTLLHEMWRKGEFFPLDDEECLDLIVEIKKNLPKWVRTMRIQRDIPAGLISAGVKKGNIGELVQERLENEGIRCRCIRCREAGHMGYKKGIQATELEILMERYDASLGLEHFISAEDVENDIISGYLRLRFPSKKAHREEVDIDIAMVRELKVIGPAMRLGEKSNLAEQHQGIGTSLLERAEGVAKEGGKRRLLVLSAVGTREYYRKRGYDGFGNYMVKEL